MNKKLIDFFILINDGKIVGGQKKLADLLGISRAAVNNWIKGKGRPSEICISKMAEISGKSENEVSKLFTLKSGFEKSDVINNEFEKLKEQNKNLEEKIVFLQEKIKFLEEQISFYKENYKK